MRLWLFNAFWAAAISQAAGRVHGDKNEEKSVSDKKFLGQQTELSFLIV